jgi:hypothetical protein
MRSGSGSWNMNHVRVEGLMTTAVVTVAPETPLRE